jgi:chromosome segregation protein
VAQLKEVEQERMSSEQKLGPLRDRINEVKLKEQEARINEEQYAQQLIEAAHGICPYSKAVHGNIDVTTTLV